MKLFRLARKPGSGEEERELVLDTDAETQALDQDGTETDVESEALADQPTADAAAETEESTPTPGPQDIPIQELLSDLVGLSHRLGAAPRARTEPPSDETPDTNDQPNPGETPDANDQPSPDETPDANDQPSPDETPDTNDQPTSDETPDTNDQPTSDETPEPDARPDGDGEAPEPDDPWPPQAERPSLTGYRRYALHGLFLSLALIVAAVGLMGAQRLALTEPVKRSPIVVATVPGVAPELNGQPETTPDPTPEPTPEPPPILTPEPIPGLQPAYFIYTVQPGDTVSGIADVFAINPSYILWNNPDVVYDPNLLLVGQQLFVPSVDGIIYHVRPGDNLSDIATLYQIDVESILAFGPNGLTSPNSTIEGMILILPGAVPPSNAYLSP
jgi:LysM repeat protein